MKTLYGMFLATCFVVTGATYCLSQPQLPPAPKVKTQPSDTAKEQSKDETPKPATKPPVPVAVGKEPDDKTPTKPATPVATPDDKTPPPAASEDGGTIPLTFVKNRIDNMKPGQSGFVALESVRVDSKLRCYLDPTHIFGSQLPARPIAVRRDEKGYHITLEAIEHQWVAQELPSSVHWLPVKTVTAK